MFKRFTLILFVVMASTWAHAQLLEGLLFGAASSLINTQIAKNQEKVFPAGKLNFDILVPAREGGYQFTNTTYDPTTQTRVFVVDGLALQVKPFINGPPPHDMQVFINDAAYTMRHVKGGKFKSNGLPYDNAGVVGDYPIIDSADLPYGSCQIKVRLSKTLWLSAEFVRLRSVEDLMAIFDDEDLRKKLYGFGGATFPVVPTFLARMPNGQIRTFLSVEEMQLALNVRPPVSAQQDNPQLQPTVRDGMPKGTDRNVPAQSQQELVEKAASIEIHVGLYDRAAYSNRQQAEAYAELAAEAEKQPPVPLDYNEPISIPNDRGLAIFVLGKSEFKAQLINPDGKLLREFAVIFVKQSGDYALFIPLTFGSGSTNNTLVFSDGNVKRELHFKRG